MDFPVYKYHSACRICLQESKQNVSLFDERAVKYLQIIKECVGLNIIKHDILPSNICSTCVSEIKIIDQFISKCKSSYEKLERVLTTAKDTVITIKEEESDNPKNILKFDEIKIEYNNDTKCDDDYDDHNIFSTDNERCDYNDIKPTDSETSKKESKEHVKKESKPVKRKYIKSILKSKLKKKEFVCETCDIKFMSKAALTSHSRKHTGEKPYACDICKSCFSQSSTLVEHKGRVHNLDQYMRKKTFMCDHCGKVCYRKSELLRHARVHTKEKPFICDYCHKGFSEKHSLIPHIRLHQGIKPFTCHICGTCHTSHSSLSSHMNRHSDVRKFLCHICNKPLKSASSLKIHLRSQHVEAKPYACDKCGRRFSQKNNMKKHILVQHSDRAGDCDICKKHFSDISVHNQIHNGVRPFKCNHCDKAYIKNSHLKKHLRRVRESSKLECASCEATFALQTQLEYHTLKYHTKEFAFKCGACPQGFYRLSDFKRHQNLNVSCKIFSLKNPDEKL